MRLRKGTRAACANMESLRFRQRWHLKNDLIAEWARVTGNDPREWWTLSGLPMGCGIEVSILWLRNAIAAAGA